MEKGILITRRIPDTCNECQFCSDDEKCYAARKSSNEPENAKFNSKPAWCPLEPLSDFIKRRAIGTVEECRAAVEKQRAKKPHIWGDGYDDKGNIIYDMYDCPNCGKTYEIDYSDYKYCPECGQCMDRSDCND